MNKRANSVVEYAIILGVVILALSTMNIYIKRGVQGKVKDLSDGFIGAGSPMQAETPNVMALSTSSTNSVANSTVTTRDLLGGSREVNVSEHSSMNAISRTEDIKKNPVPDTSTTGTDSAIVDPIITSNTQKTNNKP